MHAVWVRMRFDELPPQVIQAIFLWIGLDAVHYSAVCKQVYACLSDPYFALLSMRHSIPSSRPSKSSDGPSGALLLEDSDRHWFTWPNHFQQAYAQQKLSMRRQLFWQNRNLNGAIPGQSLSHLSSTLTQLLLHDNNLEGVIPTEIGLLVQLTDLSLSNNSIHGPIPVSLACCTRLQHLALDRNLISGEIPAKVLQGLQRLRYLSLSENQLSGAIPPEIGHLADMYCLLLDHNFLSGPIPRQVGKLERLQYLDLTSNYLTGTVPREIARLENLAMLMLEDNLICGPLPLELIDLSHRLVHFTL
ncbi:hypothetical protein HDU77_006031 [Chytriomyces hyalinus]|nr:hypothetical protein HDU77_006031 [Chytriomyces hyalinus]